MLRGISSCQTFHDPPAGYAVQAAQDFLGPFKWQAGGPCETVDVQLDAFLSELPCRTAPGMHPLSGREAGQI